MYRYVFAVGDEIYCCWDYDLPERNEQFLKSFDTEYFNYLANRYLDQLEGQDCQRAALALRAAYHHGLETLFSLLGALAQAPSAVLAWIPRCSNSTLREVVSALQSGSPILTQTGRQNLTLPQLSRIVHQCCWSGDKPSGATGDRFGRLWSRFSHDFLDEDHIAEYNSIKHGLRVAPGGFVLKIGQEEQPGVQAPEANMKTIGGSPYGSSYFQAEPVIQDRTARHHIRIRHHALNWSAEAMRQRLQLVAWSINNVVGGLRCLNGAQPERVKFHRPENPAAFDTAWEWHVGAHSSSIDIIIEAGDIDPVSREDLVRELESRAPKQEKPRDE